MGGGGLIGIIKYFKKMINSLIANNPKISKNNKLNVINKCL